MLSEIPTGVVPGADRAQTLGDAPSLVLAGLLVAFAPLTLLAFNQNWIFTPEGFLDPWHYVGFFREYTNPDYSPGVYKLARLPWILAGYVVNSVLPPAPAAYVLHGLFLSLTPLALFAGLYLLLNRVALAAVVATMFGFYTHAHGSGGWDYHNTAAGAFYLLAFALLALPGTIAGRPLHLLGAGAMTALALHANITFVNFIPVLALVYLKTVHVRTGQFPNWRVVIARCAWCAAGGVLVTVVLGLINVLAGREFLFFALLTSITAQYVADPERVAQWRLAAGWILTARHLSLLGAVFITGALALVLYRRTRNQADRLALTLILQFLIMLLVWTGWQLAGQLALDWYYFAYVLIPSCFIAVGGLLSLKWPEACERHWQATILGTAAVCLICLAAGINSSMRSLPPSVTATIAVVGCAIFCAGLLAFLSRSTVATVSLLIATYAFGNALVSGGGYGFRDPCKIREDVYAAIVDGASWLGTVDPAYTRVRTWFDEKEEIQPAAGCPVNVGLTSGSITAMAFVPYVTTPWPMPGVDTVPQAALVDAGNSESILAILTSRAEHLEAWGRRLDQLGVDHEEIGQHRIPLIAAAFSIHAWQLTPKPPAISRLSAPIIAVTDQTPHQLNVYGVPEGEVVNENGHVVFKLTDIRDHLAYAPTLFPPLENETWAEVTIELPPSGRNAVSCRLVVQNPGFNTLGAMRCANGKRYVRLPPGTNGLRVYLADSGRRPIVVPRRIEVALEDAAR